jgi:hypothetical protein
MSMMAPKRELETSAFEKEFWCSTSAEIFYFTQPGHKDDTARPIPNPKFTFIYVSPF